MAEGEERFSPFVYWGQKTDHISLKIDLKEVLEPKVNLTEDCLKFESEGIGVRGRNYYQFDIDFYHPVDPDKSRYRVLDRCIEFHIQKRGDGEVWPRLSYHKIKLPWLKIDFDKVVYEDETESEDEGKMSQEEVMKQIEKQLELDKSEKPDVPDLKTAYLFLYNLFQFVGFTYITCVLLINLFLDKNEALSTGFKLVGTQMMICQAAAVMEILHPVLGLVKTSALAPLVQVLGRNFILFVVLLHEDRLFDAPVVFCLLLVWSIIEVIRYPFYMLAVFKKKNYIITWLRYTAWVPLYPLGIFMEGTVVIMATPLYEQTQMFSLHLPNSANMAFYFPWFLRFYLVILIAGGYTMLNYMRAQRKKVLLTPDKSKKTA